MSIAVTTGTNAVPWRPENRKQAACYVGTPPVVLFRHDEARSSRVHYYIYARGAGMPLKFGEASGFFFRNRVTFLRYPGSGR